jgi:hypothetical protein
MAQIPSATTTLDPNGGPTGAPVEYLAIFAACKTNADMVPRLFSSLPALLEQHDYCEGAEFAGLFANETGLPFMFVPLPIVTAGTIGRRDTTGVTGTSVITFAAAAGGVLAEVDLTLRVFTGGTIGTNGIILDLALDDTRTFKKVRLGTATSYTIPYVGIVINFAAGTLIADDEATCKSTAPRWDQAGLQAGRIALAAQQKRTRSWLVIGDLVDDDDADDVLTEANAYETANDRFVGARCQISDRTPQATLEQAVHARMAGAPSLTFAEVGGTGDTITRATGSWIADGFAVNDWITVTDSASNNVSGRIAALSATVITLDAVDLAAEVTVLASVVATTGLRFAEVGATGDTITRSRGSWVADGFRVGDLVTIAGTASNNITAVVGIATLTATVLTFDTTDLVAEDIGATSVTMTAGQTMAAWVASSDAEFSDVDDEPHINLALGRARKMSPIIGYRMRRPAQWATTIRSYQNEIHLPTWAKEDGPLSGWDLEDEDGITVEYDERITGGALAGRFTCLRTWANGPNGTFVALDLTRAEDDTLLSRQHNADVTWLAMNTVQRSAENAIGRLLRKKAGVAPGTQVATESSLVTIEEAVNTDLAIALMQDTGKGPKADSVRWVASRLDVVNVAGARLNGVLRLNLNGTIEHMNTVTVVS